MTAAVNRALEDAIRRAYALGRVDQSIDVAAEQLRAMVKADPRIAPRDVLRLCGAPAGSRYAWDYDWDHVLWTVADLWCELQRELLGRPTRTLPASPYSPLHTIIRSAYEAGWKAGEAGVRGRVLSVFDDDPAAEVADAGN